MLSNDKNVQIILALLKEYGIRKIVVSPGTKNVPVALSIQHDSFFEVYSVVDERSAAYFANGLAYESGEPVVITCTGATASRNYLPGLTEAYYRRLPIIALTCGHQYAEPYTLTPQNIDRTISQNDVKLISVFLPIIHNDTETKQSAFLINKALTLMKNGGPVHINILTDSDYTFSDAKLPSIKKINFFSAETLLQEGFEVISKALEKKKIGVFIGSHLKFCKKLTSSLENFATKYGAAIFCDHTSGYCGKNRIQINDRLINNIKNKPDVIIDIGGISGAYADTYLFNKSEIWRVSEDGAFLWRQMQGNLTHVFSCSEAFFFSGMSSANPNYNDNSKYYEYVYDQMSDNAIPDLPLSNTLISSRISELLPNGASLHLGILNSLRNMNLFALDSSIDSSCNVGGFGIDGAVSTVIGQSMADKSRLYFGLLGDLAFFYDMNSLGIRHLSSNVRLLIVNNRQGVEFRLNPAIETPYNEKLDALTSAKGHFGTAKGWAESVGFHYMSADTKEEFLSLIGEFCNDDVNYFGKPVIFEVFTEVKGEQEGLRLFTETNLNNDVKAYNVAKSIARKMLSPDKIEKIKKVIK